MLFIPINGSTLRLSSMFFGFINVKQDATSMSCHKKNKPETNHGSSDIKNRNIEFDITENPIITVKEARKLLGAQYESMPDDEVTEIIAAMSRLATTLLD